MDNQEKVSQKGSELRDPILQSQQVVGPGQV